MVRLIPALLGDVRVLCAEIWYAESMSYRRMKRRTSTTNITLPPEDSSEKEIDMKTMWVLVLCTAALLLACCTQADARTHRRHRPREIKIFAAKPDSILLENEIAEGMGAYRYFTQAQVDAAVQDGTLVRLYTSYVLIVSPKLPMERRYALPATVAFINTLATEFFLQFHQTLMVDSAIRPATVQRGLHMRNAAPPYGPRASTHERGTSIDFAKHFTKAQYHWIILRLLYYKELGRILVIEERSCLHIFVIGEPSGNS